MGILFWYLPFIVFSGACDLVFPHEQNGQHVPVLVRDRAGKSGKEVRVRVKE